MTLGLNAMTLDTDCLYNTVPEILIAIKDLTILVERANDRKDKTGVEIYTKALMYFGQKILDLNQKED